MWVSGRDMGALVVVAAVCAIDEDELFLTLLLAELLGFDEMRRFTLSGQQRAAASFLGAR